MQPSAAAPCGHSSSSGHPSKTSLPTSVQATSPDEVSRRSLASAARAREAPPLLSSRLFCRGAIFNMTCRSTSRAPLLNGRYRHHSSSLSSSRATSRRGPRILLSARAKRLMALGTDTPRSEWSTNKRGTGGRHVIISDGTQDPVGPAPPVGAELVDVLVRRELGEPVPEQTVKLGERPGTHVFGPGLPSALSFACPPWPRLCDEQARPAP